MSQPLAHINDYCYCRPKRFGNDLNEIDTKRMAKTVLGYERVLRFSKEKWKRAKF